ncbi:MAG: hypothetical protein AB7H97_21450 [Pseudobdellovibrionaceae bacterium]
MRVALGLVLLMGLAACSTVSRRDLASDATFKGIACESEDQIPARFNMKKPRFTVLITNIGSKNATLHVSDLKEMLETGNLPDRRNARLQIASINGVSGYGYIADKSNTYTDSRPFTVYTNGTTPKDTTKGTLSFLETKEEFKLNCADGMEQKP